MIERERVIEIYAEAYKAETGFDLTLEQIDNIEFGEFTLEYYSRSGKSILIIYEFTDNDTFPGPDTVSIVKCNTNKNWRLVL